MKKFEEGKTYTLRSICDHECIFEITVISRTEKSLTYLYEKRKRRSSLRTDNDSEFIRPDNYSMAPVFRATAER